MKRHHPYFDRAVPSEDQLPMFSRMGRGPKGDSFEVVLREDVDGSQHLEGVSTDEATGEKTTEWKSIALGAGYLTHQYSLSPETGTFILSMSYTDPNPDRSWNWTSPAIPYSVEEIDGQNVARVKSVFTGTLDSGLEEALKYPDGYTGSHMQPTDDWVSILTVGLDADIVTGGENQELILSIEPKATLPAATAKDLENILGFSAEEVLIPAASGLSDSTHQRFRAGEATGQTLKDWILNYVGTITPGSVAEIIQEVLGLFKRNQSNIDVIRRDYAQAHKTADGVMLEASNLPVQDYDPNNPNQPWNDANLTAAAHTSVYATYSREENDGITDSAYADMYARVGSNAAQLRLNPTKDSTLTLGGQDLRVSNGGLYVSGDYPIVKVVTVQSPSLSRKNNPSWTDYYLPRASYDKQDGFAIGAYSNPSKNPMRFTPPAGYTPIGIVGATSNHNHTHPFCSFDVAQRDGIWGVFLRGMTYMAQPVQFTADVLCLYTGR